MRPGDRTGHANLSVEPGAIHDFKNLLTVISGHGELLYTQLRRDDPLWRSADAIRKAVESATALMTRLLATARRPEMSAEVIELNELVTTVGHMIEGALGRNVDLSVRLDTAAGRVRVSRAELEQVIVNLAVNAQAAMPDGGRFMIETGRLDIAPGAARRLSDPPPGAWATVVVSDTGTGMEPWVASRLFEPYFTTKPGTGTGLGLATARAITRRHGGDITVTTAVGVGSSFRVYLPRVSAQVSDRNGNGGARPATSRGSETVLVIESETEVRDLVREILELHGYTVLDAQTLADAQTIAARADGRIDLVITDPLTRGAALRELIGALRRGRPDLKVLYVSGQADEDIARRAGPLDGALLRKPFAVGALTKRIRELLDT